jgi:hypothetical protein
MVVMQLFRNMSSSVLAIFKIHVFLAKNMKAYVYVNQNDFLSDMKLAEPCSVDFHFLMFLNSILRTLITVAIFI